MVQPEITISGARQHNLKNIDVSFPKNALVVVTGLSGSGKSSLAFDTLYAEGQRRYVESLSTYARQFLGQMEKPDVDFIDGLSPAIAIEQKSSSHNPRSTVGTVTEIYDFLRLLYARAGTPHCPSCGKEVGFRSLDEIIGEVLDEPEGTRILITAPLPAMAPDAAAAMLRRLRREGYSRVRVGSRLYELDDLPEGFRVDDHPFDVIIDRIVIKEGMRNRLADSLELAARTADGKAGIDLLAEGSTEVRHTILYSEEKGCSECGITLPDYTPATFSFNSPQGACQRCGGLGTTEGFDPGLIVPDPDLSLREGAVAPWASRSSVQFAEFLDALTHHYGTSIYTPFRELSAAFKKVVLKGSGKETIPFYFEKKGRRVTYETPFEGVIPALQKRLDDATTASEKEDVRRFMTQHPCPACRGSRLNDLARAVRIDGHAISDITAMSVEKALATLSEFSFSGKTALVAAPILRELTSRLTFLTDVGLSYLTLSRGATTLSGGESQRIRLATQIGSKLSGVLYVLDEPSIGLHQRDNRRLIDTLKKIRDLGNTVLVVEHDTDTIYAADHLIDMGPAAGIRGGQVVYSGPPSGITACEESLTGLYFSGRRGIEPPLKRRPHDKGCLTLMGARANNLKEVTVDFPLGTLTCVTGVSGSGKSTLVLTTLKRVLSQKLSSAKERPGDYTRLEGLSLVDRVIGIDQSPIGKTPRSNPATYTGLFNAIRDIFAKTKEARERGYKQGRFSFNMKGGRCEACQGDGIVKIEMHFLPDVYVPCDVCGGKRYNRDTLDVRYRGKNIADVLDMTVNQAFEFFKSYPVLRAKLETLIEVGMGYIHLGQAATTLSGGEAQRIKLARELSKKGGGHTVYILDEPTTGLHLEDIRKLMLVLNRLVDAGNTILIIEHNLDVIKCADHVIDLGPEGGEGGGTIVAVGTPEEIAANPHSVTGRYLKESLPNTPAAQ
ncbi:excinuclease ABC subunit UvrA [Desulfoluna butyratoxydans]|uniref:UvrABC system protein A n=1 Tax=Desulfoluna butyratoxydans TaxID=231438 RepID=A0A4U8YHE1_9BACT|nr:excinuclease ABC subunit UvrA [Desulfoluna butyratoxydans]VFQ42574.1 uvrabc system subunit a [Desulfoluna butyratoxydans]